MNNPSPLQGGTMRRRAVWWWLPAAVGIVILAAAVGQRRRRGARRPHLRLRPELREADEPPGQGARPALHPLRLFLRAAGRQPLVPGRPRGPLATRDVQAAHRADRRDVAREHGLPDQGWAARPLPAQPADAAPLS